MISPETTHDSPGGNDPDPGAEYLDTIALLQDEISLLESELQARRDDDLESRVSPAPDGDAAATALLQQSLDRTRDELSARDETISFLLEQLRLIEDAESASRAEWEQLAQWVSEVEERVEGQDLARNRGDEEERAELRRGALEARSQLEHERKTWAAERRRLEEEAGRLQALLARAAAADGGGEPGAAAALEALESENRRLRHSYRQLEQTSRAETEALRSESRSGADSTGRSAQGAMSWSRMSAYASAESTRRRWRRIALRSPALRWRRAKPLTSPTRARRRQTTRSRWMLTCESERSAST